VVEDDHAVRHVLLDAIAGESPVAALAGDDGCYPAVLQPGEEPAQFRSQDGGVGQGPEQRFDRVDHHPLRADGIDGGTEPEEQALQIPFSDDLDVWGQGHVIDDELSLRHKLAEVETERRHIRDEVLRGFLERDKDAGLPELSDALDEKLRCQQRLSAARWSADQRRPAPRQATAGHLIETCDSGESLG
jgi:hypothetical protein